MHTARRSRSDPHDARAVLHYPLWCTKLRYPLATLTSAFLTRRRQREIPARNFTTSSRLGERYSHASSTWKPSVLLNAPVKQQNITLRGALPDLKGSSASVTTHSSHNDVCMLPRTLEALSWLARSAAWPTTTAHLCTTTALHAAADDINCECRSVSPLIH